MDKTFYAASVCAILLACTAPIPAIAQAQLAKAQQLMAADQYEQALHLLESAHDPTTATTQEFFLLGMAAKQAGDLPRAEKYFRAALEREPGAGRIRLELAEVLFRQGKLDASRAELVAVQDSNPPEQVRQNIGMFIAQVDAAKADPRMRPQGPQKNWSAYITAGFTSDSNVNAGPENDTVFLYGLPFTLSSDAQKTQDIAFFLRAGVSHQHQLDSGITWRTNLNLSYTKHSKSSAYDTTNLSASTGPSFRIGERVGLSVPITFDIQRFNEQGGWHTQSVGLAPRLQFAAHPQVQVFLDTSVLRKRYRGNSDRNLTAYTFNPSLNYQPTENGNIALGLQYGREISGLDIHTNTVLGAYLGYQHVFREQGIRASVTASYTDTKFKGIQAAQTVARHDISRRISANMSYDLPQVQGLSLLGSVSYQDNKSNIDMNNYDRLQLSLSVTRRF
ncbi:porin family protein [Roseinatronobacter monicus]|uniref:Tetratricopeptide repeat protein n=1 Tax=Roseinatronobacter monicus TaxID=393481 RepID=A0A543K4F6_9RHOB|nr:porin family protein [Roseinatronobacter monicus]TQM89914.1 tetratricopeptide repeat protein [Roseinatronobacter monicus]